MKKHFFCFYPRILIMILFNNINLFILTKYKYKTEYYTAQKLRKSTEILLEIVFLVQFTIVCSVKMEI